MAENPNTLEAQLYTAVAALRDPEECRRFLADLCTVKELRDMAQRLEAARLLRQGLPYHEIARLTGTSTATISRVSRALHYGAGGYTLLLERGDVHDD